MKYKPYQFTTGGKPVHYSYSHLYKFHDAILFVAHQEKVPLPEVYELEMQSYLESIKKEKIKAKNQGKLEEIEADPISFELYRILWKHKIDTENIFLFSCMTRYIWIDNLTFGQIALGTDSLVIEYLTQKLIKKVRVLHQKTTIVIHLII